MRIWFGVFFPSRFMWRDARRFRWYAFGHIDPVLPFGLHLVAGALDWFLLSVWWPSLRRVADAGYMEIDEGEVMGLRKIRPWRVREPYQRKPYQRRAA